MDVLSDRTYKLVLRRTARGPVVQLKSSTPHSRESTLVRLGGRGAEEVFRVIVEALDRHGFIEESGGSNSYRYYKIKREAGPVVGGFLVLMRRSRDPMAWLSHFEGLLTGKYRGAQAVLRHALSLGIELSFMDPPPERVRMQLNPRILDGISAGIKLIAKKLWGLRE